MSVGPTLPNPGPILPSVAATAPKADSRSIPSKVIMITPTTKMNMNSTKKPRIFINTSRLTVVRPSRTGTTAWGCNNRTISLNRNLTSTISRTTFMPPPVEPAQPPMNIRNSSVTWGANPHCS